MIFMVNTHRSQRRDFEQFVLESVIKRDSTESEGIQQAGCPRPGRGRCQKILEGTRETTASC